jgi:tetratricopeptide (TPR) repeat protein
MWSRRCTEIGKPSGAAAAATAVLRRGPMLAVVPALIALAACAHAPVKPRAPAQPIAAVRGGASPPPAPAVPAQAQQQFAQALTQAKAGERAAAESGLRSLVKRYPTLTTPWIDLGLLYREDDRLDASAAALERAVGRDPASALAWTELGVTQRLRGKFAAARQAYDRAIAADPKYAPAYLDRGVLLDLFLDQPAAALADYQRYQSLAGPKRTVTMWMAEVQHRLAAAAAKTAQTAAGTASGAGD